MLRRIITAQPIGGYRLHLRFDDGADGVVDVAAIVPLEGVFAELREPEAFARAYVDPEAGTVCWPNGADLDPVVLYSRATGTPIPEYADEVMKQAG
ncbi:MAG: DUF2442 domain-containing protein [Deltaproteobacteria bacterium]|nr:DUF2442 domain-containing protein [Deltaproteobacteria bacterium]